MKPFLLWLEVFLKWNKVKVIQPYLITFKMVFHEFLFDTKLLLIYREIIQIAQHWNLPTLFVLTRTVGLFFVHSKCRLREGLSKSLLMFCKNCLNFVFLIGGEFGNFLGRGHIRNDYILQEVKIDISPFLESIQDKIG